MNKVVINDDSDDQMLDNHDEPIVKKDSEEGVDLDNQDGQSTSGTIDTDDDTTNADNDSTAGDSKSDPDESDNLVEIDGEEYSLVDGNAVDKDGEVKYTAEQLKEFEEQDVTDGINVSSILELTNIKPLDEEGNPIEYENTPEGIAKYVSDSYAIAETQGVESFKNNLFTAYPAVIDFIEHLNSNNGNPEGFKASPDYSKVTLDKENEDQLRNVIISGRVARGESQEKAEKYYNYAKDSDAILTEAEEELQFLVKQDEAANNAKAEAEQARIEQERDEAAKYWGIDVVDGKMVDLNKDDSIYGIIKSGKLKVDNDTYNIPDKIRISENGKVSYKSKDDFFNYLYEPVTFQQGNDKFTMTRYDYDLQVENSKRSVNNDLLDAYKRFTKYDMSQLVKEKVNQEEVKRAKKRYSSKQRKAASNTTRDASTEGKRIVIPGTI